MAANINHPDVVSIEDLPAVASLAELLGPDYKQQIAAQMRAMERMTPAERVAAMYRGELRGPALHAWATSRPHELPNTTLATAIDGPDGAEGICCTDGELPWILALTPEFCGD
jgi:hypothetical protein